MRRIRLAGLLVTAAVAAFAIHSGASESVTYSPSLDAGCSVLRGSSIEDEWKEELKSRLDEYRNMWSAIGPGLQMEAAAISGIPQSDRTRVRLTLCDAPSNSFLGVTVNMRYALKSFSASPVPLRYKIDTQFHELLHRALVGYVPANSPLLVRYGELPECVRNHVHLLALQKAVLIRRAELKALQDVVRIDSSLQNSCYREAWDIVNASDAEYLSYVSEIATRSAPRPGPDSPLQLDRER